MNEIQQRIDTLITEGKSIMICWIPAHVGIKGNEEADRAAKEAIKEPRADTHTPARDYHPSLRKWITNKWQRIWEIQPQTNKLRSIREKVTPWKSTTNERTAEVILTRLRIGHTRLTHCNLMEKPNGPPPRCNGCNVKLTVRHIIEECPQVTHHRRNTIGEKRLEEILGEEADIARIMEFLKVIGVDTVI